MTLLQHLVCDGSRYQDNNDETMLKKCIPFLAISFDESVSASLHENLCQNSFSNNVHHKQNTFMRLLLSVLPFNIQHLSLTSSKDQLTSRSPSNRLKCRLSNVHRYVQFDVDENINQAEHVLFVHPGGDPHQTKWHFRQSLLKVALGHASQHLPQLDPETLNMICRHFEHLVIRLEPWSPKTESFERFYLYN